MPMTRKLTLREKRLVALRLTYMGGYTGYFAQRVHALIADGFTPEELLAVAVDDTMRKWIADALTQK